MPLRVSPVLLTVAAAMAVVTAVQIGLMPAVPCRQTEMWLVFRDEGVSLRHYLYTQREAEGFVLHGQSSFWRDMRLDPNGPEVSITRDMYV